MYYRSISCIWPAFHQHFQLNFNGNLTNIFNHNDSIKLHGSQAINQSLDHNNICVISKKKVNSVTCSFYTELISIN